MIDFGDKMSNCYFDEETNCWYEKKRGSKE